MVMKKKKYDWIVDNWNLYAKEKLGTVHFKQALGA